MAGQSARGMLGVDRGAGQGQPGPSLESPAATEADIYELQRRQQGGGAQPVFGGEDQMARAAAIRQMLTAGGQPRQGGPTQIRRSAQQQPMGM